MILREKAKKRDNVRLSITGSIIILESAPALFLIVKQNHSLGEWFGRA